MDKLSKKFDGALVTHPVFQLAVMLVFVVGAFFMGSLWTKVSILEKGTSLPAKVADNAAPSGENAPSAPQEAAVAPKLAKDDHFKGEKNARIILFEYSDFECPFCKTVHPTIVQVMDTYKTQVAWVYRHFPLGFHANAQKEAEASECVATQGGDTAFWKFSDAIYERTTSNGTGFALEKLGPLAAEVGVKQATFQDCLDKGEMTQKVKDQAAQGGKEGIQGTPGIILLDTKTGKTQVVPGAVPFDQMKTMIDGMLK